MVRARIERGWSTDSGRRETSDAVRDHRYGHRRQDTGGQAGLAGPRGHPRVSDQDNAAATSWAEQAGPYGHSGTFADAAAFGDVLINATAGTVSLKALRAAGAERLAGKVLIDVSNALVFSPTGEVTLDR